MVIFFLTDILETCKKQLKAKIKPIFSSRDLETIIYAFISFRLDYCNVLYLGLSQSLVNPLVQNAT